MGHLFATDGRNVFSTRGALKEIDAATFKLVEECFEPNFETYWVSAYAVTPQRAVYVDDLNAPRLFQPKVVADLRVLAPHFATDGAVVYWNGVKIAGAEPSSFRPLSSTYSLDRRHCFFGTARIVGADPTSFELLGDAGDRNLHLSYDENSLYSCEQPVLNLAGSVPELQREERRYVTGVFDGERMWTTFELDTIYRSIGVRTSRTVLFAETSSDIKYTDAMFAGLEGDLSIFLMLCTHKTIQALEEFTRGKRGEKAVVRSIERLNSQLSVKLALIAPTTINITSDGIAAYRQYGAVVGVLSGILAGLKR